MLALTEFRTEKYVRSWLVIGRQSANDNISCKRKKKIDKKIPMKVIVNPFFLSFVIINKLTNK